MVEMDLKSKRELARCCIHFAKREVVYRRWGLLWSRWHARETRGGSQCAVLG